MKTTNILVIITIILVLASTAWTHYILNNNLKEIVKEAVLEVEYNKVGWKENFEKINEIQKKQIKLVLDQYEQQNPSLNNPTPTNTQQEEQQNPSQVDNWKTISMEQLKKIKEWTYVLWNPDAEISFIEYSDLECPFCKRLHESWAIEKILKEYNGKVNFIFKHFPLYFHPQAQMEAEAAECVAELWGKDKYYNFIQKVFENSSSNGRSYTKESISDLASKIWIDKTKILSCINSWKYTWKVKSQEQEGASIFNVTWTPWNVLINNKTWKWEILPGAYPYEAFKQKIDSLLSK